MTNGMHTGRVVLAIAALVLICEARTWAAVGLEEELVFPARADHNHAAGIVECPNGDLLVSWYRGSGERTADDVAVYGARRRAGQKQWSAAFVMADTPGFPDCNTAMFVDAKERVWLFWPTVIANSWESCITNYRVSKNYAGEGSPVWDWQGVILLKPKDFEGVMLVRWTRE